MFELCWNITAKCNMGCEYCHRFFNPTNLSKDENLKILDNIIKSNIKNITWTGGEALLIPYLPELMRIAHEHGIKNKLITNGILLTEEKLSEISKYVDIITLSIDSTNDEINNKLGRGKDHFERISKCIENIKKYDIITVKINTVLTKINTDEMQKLGEFLAHNQIKYWRIFKFMPLRELSLKSKDKFDISDEVYQNILENIKSKFSSINLEQRTFVEFETLYVLNLANGDIYITENQKDRKLGNALEISIKDAIIKK